jgi:large subunit ribosomal protein L23
MDLTIYDIIKGPVISEKAYKLNKKTKKLMLKVHPAANKPLIASAVEKLFNVEVEDVCTYIRKGKNRTVKRRVSSGSDMKIAVVTLAKGQSLDMFDQAAGNLPTAATNTKQ